MALTNYLQALQQARRQAKLFGRPLTEQETRGVTAGSLSDATSRLAAGKQIELQEKGLEQEKEMQKESLATTSANIEKQIQAQAENLAKSLSAQREETLLNIKAGKESDIQKSLLSRGLQFTELGQQKALAEKELSFKQSSFEEEQKLKQEALDLEREKMEKQYDIAQRNSGGGGGFCVIVTACTHPDSFEVNITRKFRDYYLDDRTLRGYYRLAEKLVPLMKRKEWFKRWIKKIIVDRLIDYGQQALGYRAFRKYRTSAFVKIVFLKICKMWG